MEKKGVSLYTFGIALFAAIGTFLFVRLSARISAERHLSNIVLRALTRELQRLVCRREVICRLQRPANYKTAIAHQSWVDYMHHPSHGLTGAVRITWPI